MGARLRGRGPVVDVGSEFCPDVSTVSPLAKSSRLRVLGFVARGPAAGAILFELAAPLGRV